jgi:hypothetical protein
MSTAGVAGERWARRSIPVAVSAVADRTPSATVTDATASTTAATASHVQVRRRRGRPAAAPCAGTTSVGPSGLLHSALGTASP